MNGDKGRKTKQFSLPTVLGTIPDKNECSWTKTDKTHDQNYRKMYEFEKNSLKINVFETKIQNIWNVWNIWKYEKAKIFIMTD